MTDVLRWHDLECGRYAADLPLWRELAEEAGGEVLDLGCGSGRVALDLARHGHAVTGVDIEPALLGALRERAGDLPVTAVQADARDFDLGERRFALCVMPMQTIQILGGAEARASCLRAARRHLRPGGTLAAALADALEGIEPGRDEPPAADTAEEDGVVYRSQPVAVYASGAGVVIKRVREVLGPDGRRDVEGNAIRLDSLSGEELEDEGLAAGFAVAERRRVEETDEHVGSEVVVLRA
jgi:SAM-dependent methyltransferase